MLRQRGQIRPVPLAETIRYSYDGEGRISDIEYGKERISADIDEIRNGYDLHYNTDSIWYQFDAYENGIFFCSERYVGTLDAQKRVTGFECFSTCETVSPTPNPEESHNLSDTDKTFRLSKSQEINYSEGYVVACRQTDTESQTTQHTSYDLQRKGGNCVGCRWGAEDGMVEECTMEYGNIPVRTNLDINWILYRVEGCAFVAGGDAGTHLFTTQGFCGKANKNYPTSFTLVSDKGYSGTPHTYKYMYDYSFDDEDYPEKISMRDSETTKLERVWEIEYETE